MAWRCWQLKWLGLLYMGALDTSRDTWSEGQRGRPRGRICVKYEARWKGRLDRKNKRVNGWTPSEGRINWIARNEYMRAS
ncbi:hypothetical protein BDN72DRAFT_843281 [Pluteus cervinus]|uniref:Uncharacterized protein n=1 Tax=Pluteus cervinus TaxID=181527 RepID=A0ACD3ANY7_9AGAR|nr:hypothetical protein BDN72DRAFT_843281 [Pluteus cervinus]